MSETIAQLVPKPTVSDEIKADIVKTLRNALAEAERGELVGLILISKYQDSKWRDVRSGITEFCDTIGKLEVIKQFWIDEFRRQNRK